VKRLSREGAESGSQRRVGQLCPPRLTVRRVADKRPSARGEMDADLMRAAGHDPALKQRQAGSRSRDAREPLESRDARRADRCRGDDTSSIPAIASEPQLDRPSSDLHASVDHGQVGFLAAL